MLPNKRSEMSKISSSDLLSSLGNLLILFDHFVYKTTNHVFFRVLHVSVIWITDNDCNYSNEAPTNIITYHK